MPGSFLGRMAGGGRVENKADALLPWSSVTGETNSIQGNTCITVRCSGKGCELKNKGGKATLNRMVKDRWWD